MRRKFLYWGSEFMLEILSLYYLFTMFLFAVFHPVCFSVDSKSQVQILSLQ